MQKKGMAQSAEWTAPQHVRQQAALVIVIEQQQCKHSNKPKQIAGFMLRWKMAEKK
eukprot:m.279716 g.279716  ORF g.279716 m.279716 type:complete len:56 (-) comp104165_c0_seq1:114-281(-)